MASLNKRIKGQDKVAEIQYRDAGNNKAQMTVHIPSGLSIHVGDEVDVSKFGISASVWFNKILPAQMRGFKYDPELDHTLVEVQEERERTDEDVCINEAEKEV